MNVKARPGPRHKNINVGQDSRRDLAKLLSAAEHKATSQWGPNAAAAARRMTTVWLDETLIKSPWPGHRYWLLNPLQSDWAEGRSGGLWFFNQLDQLNPSRRDDCELARLALRCISFGLTGCHGQNPERLRQVRKIIHGRFDLKSEHPIFPPPLPPSEIKRSGIGSFWRGVLAASAFIAALSWLLCDFSLNRRLARIEQPIKLESSEIEHSTRSLHGQLDM